MNFKIFGQIRGGKNNMIVTRSGLHLPKPDWEKWRNETVGVLLRQKKSPIIETETRALRCHWNQSRFFPPTINIAGALVRGVVVVERN